MAKTKFTPMPSHENTILKAMKRADAYKRFDVDKEAMRIARRRARLKEMARKTV